MVIMPRRPFSVQNQKVEDVRRPSSLAAMKRGSQGAVSKKPQKDIKDRTVIKIETDNLIQFLCQTEYPNKINRETLKSPTGKELISIFEHMARCSDPSYRVTKIRKSFEDEFQNYFRLIGYPVTIHKQHINTPGAMHSWPHILAALDFLRQLQEPLFLPVEEMVFADVALSDVQPPILIHDCMSSLYHCFLEAEDAVTAAKIESIKNKFDADVNKALCQSGAKTFFQLSEEMSFKKDRLEFLKQSSRTLPTLKVQLEQLQITQSDKTQTLNSMQDQLASIQTSLSRTNQEQAKVRTELTQLMAHKQSLVDRISLQEKQGVDVASVVKQRVDINKKIEECDARRNALKQEIDQLEMELSRQTAKIEPILLQYNNIAAAVSSDPTSQLKISFIADISSFTLSIEEVTGNVDRIKRFTRAQLTQVKGSLFDIKTQINYVQVQIKSREMQLKEKEFHSQQRQEEENTLTTFQSAMEEEHLHRIMNRQQKLNVLTSKIDAAEAKHKSLKEINENDEKTLAEHQSRLASMKQELVSKEQEKEKYFFRTQMVMDKHKVTSQMLDNEICDLIAEIENVNDDILTTVQNILP